MKTIVEEIFEAMELARKNNLSDTFIINNLLKFKEKTIENENKMITKLKKKKMYSQLQDIEEDYKCSCCGHSEFEIKND